MKRILIITALMICTCVFFGCKKTVKISQSGVYKMDKLTVSSGGKDSVYARTQVKIYTDDHFAYASLAPDSSVGFGVGFYRLDTGNRIAESNIYSSRSLDSAQSFSLLVTRKDSGYTQVISQKSPRGVKYDVKEQYTRLPTSGTTKLDGVWKLDGAYLVNGKDTTKQTETQFKAFWGGRFMFIHRYPVDEKRTMFKNGFGYGEFSLKNDTLSESDEITSHPALLNRQFAIKITFKGDDEYSQIITDPKTKGQSVEIYRRLR